MSEDYWKDRIAATTWKTYESLEQKNRALIDYYADASKAIRDELYHIAEKAESGGKLTLSDMYKFNRLKKLNKAYEGIVERLGREIEEEVSQGMKQGFRKIYGEMTAVLSKENDFAKPNEEMMEKLLNEPWRGGMFSERLWENQTKLLKNLNQTLATGLQQGRTITEIAIMLHNRVGNTFNNVVRLVRSEMMHYLNSAALESYKNRGVTHVQIVGASDERTCEICIRYREKIYPVDKTPILPLHPNCRCTFVPVIDIISTKEDSIKMPEILFPAHNDKRTLSAAKSYARELKRIPYAHREVIAKGIREIVFTNGEPSRFDRKKKILYLRTDFVDGEAIHELAHALETEMRIYDDKRFMGVLKDGIEDYTLEDIVYLPDDFQEPVYIIRHDKLISEYQGRLYDDVGLLTEDMEINVRSLGEYFAEGYREYLLNPKRLKEKDKRLYEYIDKLGV